MSAGKRGEQRLDLARLGDAVTPRALSGQREALGRVKRKLLAVDGAAIDRAKREDRVCDRGRRKVAGDQAIDQILDLSPGDRREAQVSERGQKVVAKRCLIGADRRGLIGLARAGSDDPGPSAR